jgi:hypothetical protein
MCATLSVIAFEHSRMLAQWMLPIAPFDGSEAHALRVNSRQHRESGAPERQHGAREHIVMRHERRGAVLTMRCMTRRAQTSAPGYACRAPCSRCPASRRVMLRPARR